MVASGKSDIYNLAIFHRPSHIKKPLRLHKMVLIEYDVVSN